MTSERVDLRSPYFRTILVVDDDESVQRSLTRALGHVRTVYSATGPTSALDLTRRHRPDLAIVDMRLDPQGAAPNLGIDIIRRLKAELPSLMCGLVSGFVNIESAAAAAHAGADFVMMKPCTASAILRRAGDTSIAPTATPTLEDVEAEHIDRVVDDCCGNISEAARRLGIHRSSLQRKLRRLARRSRTKSANRNR